MEPENKVATLNPIENRHKIMTLSHWSPMQQPHFLQALRWTCWILSDKSAMCSKLVVRHPKISHTFPFLTQQWKMYKLLSIRHQATFPAEKDPRSGSGAIYRLLQGGITSLTDRHCPALTLAPNSKTSAGARNKHCRSRHYYTLHLINTPQPEIAHKAGWLEK